MLAWGWIFTGLRAQRRSVMDRSSSATEMKENLFDKLEWIEDYGGSTSSRQVTPLSEVNVAVVLRLSLKVFFN